MERKVRALKILGWLNLVAGLGNMAIYFYRRLFENYQANFPEVGILGALAMIGIVCLVVSSCLDDLHKQLNLPVKEQ